MAIEDSGAEAVVEHHTMCSWVKGGCVREYGQRSIDSL